MAVRGTYEANHRARLSTWLPVADVTKLSLRKVKTQADYDFTGRRKDGPYRFFLRGHLSMLPTRVSDRIGTSRRYLEP
jgi:hypothetical protein